MSFQCGGLSRLVAINSGQHVECIIIHIIRIRINNSVRDESMNRRMDLRCAEMTKVDFFYDFPYL